MAKATTNAAQSNEVVTLDQVFAARQTAVDTNAKLTQCRKDIASIQRRETRLAEDASAAEQAAIDLQKRFEAQGK
jgi:hypothetical protein